MTCKLGDSLYLYEIKDNNVGLFFDAIHQLVGVKLSDCYKPIDQLDQVEKNLVETLKQVAYENMKDLQWICQDLCRVRLPMMCSLAINASPAAVVHSNIQAGQVATQFGQNGQSERSHFSEESYSRFSLDSLSPTDAVMDLMQPHFQLPSNSESFSDRPDLWFNGQAIIQSQQ